MHRAARARREVEEPLELRPDRRDVRLERLAVEQVALGRATRRIADHPGPAADQRRPAGPPKRWRRSSPKIGTRWPTWSESADGIEADVAGDRPARRQAGRQARASSRAGCPATRARRGARPRPCRARVGRGRHRSATSSRLDPAGGARPVVHAPYAIVRPHMQTSLARRQRHRRALQGRPQGARRLDRRSSRSSSSSLVFLAPGPAHRGRPGSCSRVGAYNHYAAGPARPEGRADQPRRSTSRRSSTTGPARSSWPASATLQARGRHLRPDPGRDDRRDDRHRGQGLLGRTPGFDPVGIVSAGARHAVRPAARRLDDHPAARPGPPPAADARSTARTLRAQDPRDHPVRPADPGVSRARPARNRSSPPT